jgi:MoxR-like ATPase
MAEKQVLSGGNTVLDKAVLGDSNAESGGTRRTYPLPEAQIDRFMMKVFVNYLGRGS